MLIKAAVVCHLIGFFGILLSCKRVTFTPWRDQFHKSHMKRWKRSCPQKCDPSDKDPSLLKYSLLLSFAIFFLNSNPPNNTWTFF